MRAREGSMHASCTTPAANTPAASAMPGPGIQGRDPDGEDDQDDVQQHRRERGRHEAVVGIQDAAGQCGQGHEQQVGKRPAQHVHGQRKAPGIIARRGVGREARRENAR